MQVDKQVCGYFKHVFVNTDFCPYMGIEKITTQLVFSLARHNLAPYVMLCIMNSKIRWPVGFTTNKINYALQFKVYGKQILQLATFQNLLHLSNPTIHFQKPARDFQSHYTFRKLATRSAT